MLCMERLRTEGLEGQLNEEACRLRFFKIILHFLDLSKLWNTEKLRFLSEILTALYSWAIDAYTLVLSMCMQRISR